MIEVINCFKDGSSDPTVKTVPAKTIARLEQILAEANKRKGGGPHVGGS